MWRMFQICSEVPDQFLSASFRLQFVSAATKRNIVRDMTSYGIMTVNEGRAILDLPRLPGMDVFMVRGEFFQMDMQGHVVFASGGREGLPVPDPTDDPDFDLGGDDREDEDGDDRVAGHRSMLLFRLSLRLLTSVLKLSYRRPRVLSTDDFCRTVATSFKERV